MRIMRQMGHFVVMATHPDNPNFDKKSRGRKSHLGITHKKREKTLCGMLITHGVVEGKPGSGSKIMCYYCENKANQGVEKKYDGITYTFTINTDASHIPVYGGVSAWACWIKSAHYRVRGSDVFEEGVPNSAVAELLAVEQALLLLNNLINHEEFLQHHLERGRILVYFNTDSLFTVQALNGNIKRKVYTDIIKRVRSLTDRYEIEPRHVKGHTDAEDARSWVNNWCDEQARNKAIKRMRVLKHGRQKTTEKV